VSFVTNGSIILNDRQKEILLKFKNLNICVSIDGVGPSFEYIRYPLKWDLLLKNLKLFREITSNISVSFTISNLNILYYNEIIDWFKEQKLMYNHNIVENPKHFNIEVLPPHIKKDLPLITNPNFFDHELFSTFVKTIEEQDKLKNINIKDYLPELHKVIQDYTA
jgi:sulfatase maturation enzyme AslB (radical SAM superfamily)